MKSEIDIITLIESSIKKGNNNIKLFTLNLLSEIKKILSIEDLKAIIEKRLSQKNIYFIRHAEAKHNILEKKYKGNFSKCNIYDPDLTKNGINQTKKTIEKIKNEKILYDGIFISPLRRTIQTYFLVKDHVDTNKNTQIIITDFLREILSSYDKNKGIKLSILKNELKEENLNFEYITKEYWWYDLGQLNNQNELEGHQRFHLRLRLFILWLIFRVEKNMIIISHSHVFSALQNHAIRNADFVKMNNKILFEKILELLCYNDLSSIIFEKKKKK